MRPGPDPNEHVYAATCPHYNFGFDKEGHPIYIEATGNFPLADPLHRPRAAAEPRPPRKGTIDTPKLLKVLTVRDLVRRPGGSTPISTRTSADDGCPQVVRHIRQQEKALARMPEGSARVGHPVEKQLIILDLKGLSLRPHRTAMSVFKTVIQIDSDYYPERLFRFYFVNAPWIFRCRPSPAPFLPPSHGR